MVLDVVLDGTLRVLLRVPLPLIGLPPLKGGRGGKVYVFVNA